MASSETSIVDVQVVVSIRSASVSRAVADVRKKMQNLYLESVYLENGKIEEVMVSGAVERVKGLRQWHRID